MTDDDLREMASSAWDERTVRLIGAEGAARLRAARVLVVGLGGVGGYAAEMLARTGVGDLTLIDADCVETTNLNRQIIATRDTIGQPKAMLFAERFHSVNPETHINAIRDFVTPGNAEGLAAGGFDFIVDAIDTVAPKTALLAECLRQKTPVISSMGAGGRLDPSRCGYFDLWETREDGLARAVRQRLKKLGLRRHLPVVASTEAPRQASLIETPGQNKRTSYGTVAAVPAVFGILLGSYVINKLLSY